MSKLIPFVTRLKTAIYIDPAEVSAIVEHKGDIGTVDVGQRWSMVYLRGDYNAPLHLDHPIEEVAAAINEARP